MLRGKATYLSLINSLLPCFRQRWAEKGVFERGMLICRLDWSLVAIGRWFSRSWFLNTRFHFARAMSSKTPTYDASSDLRFKCSMEISSFRH